VTTERPPKDADDAKELLRTVQASEQTDRLTKAAIEHVISCERCLQQFMLNLMGPTDGKVH